MFRNKNFIPEAKQLRAFVVLAECLHFTRAAARLNVVQSALSVQIKKLEEDLEVILLNRDRRKVSLTPAGLVFQAEARAALSQLEQVTLNVRRAAVGEVGTIRIGFVTSAATTILPSVIRQYRRLHPNVRLDIQNHTTSAQLDKLKSGKLDVGFLRLPVRTGEVTVDRILSEPFVAFLPDDHPLAGSKVIPVSALRDEPFVMYARREASGFYDRIMRILNGSGFSPNIVQEASEMQLILNLVSVGLGVTILPESIHHLGTTGLVMCRLGGKWPTSDLGLATSRSSDHDELVEPFIATVRSVLKAGKPRI